MKEEKYELSHDEIPGYRPLFILIFVLSIIYLAVIFASSL